MTLIIVEILAGILVTLFGGAIYIFYKKNSLLKMQNETLVQQVDILKNRMQNEQISNTRLSTQLENVKSVLYEKTELLNQKELQLKQLQDISNSDKSYISKLQTKLSEQEKSINEKLQMLKNSEEKIKEQFTLLASKVLDSNSKKISEQNKENLELVLSPMKQQLSEFKKKVEDVYDKEAKDRSALQHELKTLKELNQQISTDAVNLTNALKGESKTQGSWGEMVLEKVLESSGLRDGQEYIREEVLKDESGKVYRPDVIVKLPENRDIIIDAKTSLSAYEQYLSSPEEQKSSYLNAHLASINRHIDSLAQKKYEKLQGVNSLDFIFMFVPIESALMLALENDTTLFDKAFKKKIVLVSPTTLVVALKAIENSWRYERQAQSTQEVVRLSEKLYSKVRSFVEDLDKVGKHLSATRKSYDDAYGKLYKGKDNIIRQIEVFKDKANIAPAKQLPNELVERAISKINDE
jgi:DNA recombination protein RmuC